uniref:Uncharacterized protein n=1 Tax=Picea glauca TaxID=3330 RepID=A0A117NH18_PICGL|nr:hypothetical protein ABT39_MTgene5845 [Picea glauca]QHR92328.1 hypothetical protein Q903MT_gene6370 [Picea sitchensis]
MGLPATTTLMYGRSVESTVGAEPAGQTPPYPIGWIAPKEMEYAKAACFLSVVEQRFGISLLVLGRSSGSAPTHLSIK